MSGWLADTFINSDGAEDALCRDRSAFLQSVQMKLIPRHIERHIVHIGDNAQIEGFRILFEHLDANPAADDLRQLVVNYFNDHPPLQPHLREPLRHHGAAAPPFKESPVRESFPRGLFNPLVAGIQIGSVTFRDEPAWRKQRTRWGQTKLPKTRRGASAKSAKPAPKAKSGNKANTTAKPKVKASAATKKAPAAKPKVKKSPAAATTGDNQKMIKPVAATKPHAAKSAPRKKTAPAASKQKTNPTKTITKQLATGTTKPKTASAASKSTKNAPTKATERQKNTPKSAQRKTSAKAA